MKISLIPVFVIKKMGIRGIFIILEVELITRSFCSFFEINDFKFIP